MEKREKIKITGVGHYADNIKSLMFENDEYSWSNKDLLDVYIEGDDIPEYTSTATHVELIPEPDNQYDPNAIRVEIEGVKVGYVKRGSCSHVKNLLNSPNFKYVMIDKFIYGNVKHVYSDENDNDYIDVREYDSPVVHLLIVSEAPPESVPAAPQIQEAVPVKTEQNNPQIPLALLIALVIFSLVLLFILPFFGIIGAIVTIIFTIKYVKEKDGNNGKHG